MYVSICMIRKERGKTTRELLQVVHLAAVQPFVTVRIPAYYSKIVKNLETIAEYCTKGGTVICLTVLLFQR
jgi:hypothetical protein